MSTSNIQNVNIHGQKFTRGEKCIFIHLVFTFALILTVVLIYLVHLFAVDHTVYDVFKTRRLFESTFNRPIGMAYLKLDSPVAVCNTILFATSWSIAPGYCVAMRTEPDMAYVFHIWRVKYTTNPNKVDIKIIRTIVHPLFVRNTLAHNIGLFQHERQEDTIISMMPPPSIYHHGDMIVGSWSESAFKEQIGVHYCPIKILNPERCNKTVSFIENIREYEFCATFSEKHNTVIEHGAIVRKDDRITGIFSWGDKNAKFLPFVMLNISFYRNWIRQQAQSYLESDEISL